MKFEVQVANYHRQLNEAALGDFFRALTTKPEKLQEVVSPSLRLENPKKNLQVIYQKLNIEQLSQKNLQQTSTQSIDQTTGKITDPDKFSLLFYEAFSRSHNGIITIDQLVRRNIGGGKNIRLPLGKDLPYDARKVSAGIMEFINKKGLGNIMKLFNSYDDAVKGTKATRIGSAIRTGVANRLKSLGSDAWNIATTKGFNEI